MDPAKPDLTHQLPRDVYYEFIHTLRAALPPVTDAPKDLAHRDNAAIAHGLPAGLTRWSPHCSPPMPRQILRPKPITMQPSIRNVPRSSVLWAAFRPSSTSARPPAEVVHAIVTGTSPVLQALDTAEHRAANAVALPAHATARGPPHAPPS
jgi:hypothetical protein